MSGSTNQASTMAFAAFGFESSTTFINDGLGHCYAPFPFSASSKIEISAAACGLNLASVGSCAWNFPGANFQLVVFVTSRIVVSFLASVRTPFGFLSDRLLSLHDCTVPRHDNVAEEFFASASQETCVHHSQGNRRFWGCFGGPC